MKEELQELGLTKNQTEIYLTLLKGGESTVSRIAKMLGLNRSGTYNDLNNLIKLGMISYTTKNYIRYYNSAPPEKLIEIMDYKKSRIERIIPELKDFEKITKKQDFKAEVYEGKEGIKTSYQHILDSGAKEILAFGVTGIAFEVMKHSFPQFLKKYEHTKITARYLANFDAKELLKQLPKNKVEIRYLPKENTSKVTTIIYRDYVAIQSLIEENISVIIIKDKNMAEGYKNYFEFMWKAI